MLMTQRQILKLKPTLLLDQDQPRAIFINGKHKTGGATRKRGGTRPINRGEDGKMRYNRIEHRLRIF